MPLCAGLKWAELGNGNECYPKGDNIHVVTRPPPPESPELSKSREEFARAGPGTQRCEDLGYGAHRSRIETDEAWDLLEKLWRLVQEGPSEAAPEQPAPEPVRPRRRLSAPGRRARQR